MPSRYIIATLVDEDMNVLVDESGNELIANIQISDFGLSAKQTKRLTHGEQAAGTAGSTLLYYTLTDESANTLTDESGNELIARISVTSRILFSNRTQRITHGG